MERQSLRLDRPTANGHETTATTDLSASRSGPTESGFQRADPAAVTSAMRALAEALDRATEAMSRSSGSGERTRVAVAIALTFGQSASKNFARLGAAIPTMRRVIDDLLSELAVRPTGASEGAGRRISNLQEDWTEILDCFRNEDLFRRRDVVRCAKELGLTQTANAVGAQMNHLVASRIVIRVRHGVYALNLPVYNIVRNDSVPHYNEGAI